MGRLKVSKLSGIAPTLGQVTIPVGHELKIDGILDLDQTGAVQLPTGNTASRPNPAVAGYLRWNTQTSKLECYDGSSWIELSSVVAGGSGLTQENPAPSALAIKTSDNNATDGSYWIKPDGYSGAAFEVLCDMTTDGGGWMHVGTISDQNEGKNNSSNHPWGYPLDPSQDTGIWNDSNTLGSQSLENDFKSQAWISSPFTQLLVKDQGNTQRNLFYTNAGGMGSNPSFSSFWAARSWDASGSENSNSCYNAGRVFSSAITNFGVSDPALDSGNKTRMLFKFGERDGAQDGNKDRSMIAYHPHDSGWNVDYPIGLGCFTNRSGTIDYRDIVPSANYADYPPNSISGAPHHYTLWVR